MRALRDPDAFPGDDPVLRRETRNCSLDKLAARSESWRPWRAYDAMLLWQTAADSTAQFAAGPIGAGRPAAIRQLHAARTGGATQN